MSKPYTNGSDGKALDAMLDAWESRATEQLATVKRLEKEQEHDLDWFDLDAYQDHVHGPRK